MAEVKKISVDVSKIRTAIQAGIPLIITTYTLPHEMELYMTDVLNTFIDELGQSQMKDCLTYCFLELVNNAKKANTKRVYFEDKGLNINDKNEYKRGMLSFKEDTINNIKYYLKKQQQEGLYIKFLLQTHIVATANWFIMMLNEAELAIKRKRFIELAMITILAK